ncbi:unnamed protein product, partial [Brassica napus]
EGRIAWKLPELLWIFSFFILEDKVVLLPWSTLKFYGEKIVKQQQRYNTPLLLSAFTHGTFQSPRPPESSFSYCRKMSNDTERSESEEVTGNKTRRDGCSRKVWITDSSVMGCENRDVHIQLFVTVLATFWPVFEAESRAWINMYVISLVNTKGVRVTGSQTSDLLDDSLAMEFAIKSLSIVMLQVVDRHIKGVVSVVGDCIWTLDFTSVLFHSPKPPDICLSEQYKSWRILSKERAIALNLVDKVVLNRGVLISLQMGHKMSLIKIDTLIEVYAKIAAQELNLQHKLMDLLELLPDSIGKYQVQARPLDLSSNSLSVLPESIRPLATLKKLGVEATTDTSFLGIY